ncbi:hypothetical protein OE88DRAFT_1649661 [Heliocybe sulcata]|uniref:Uncharacterized protein n=1 Tax=Heliocybe sulcata TaxID=5364 RepID=A0A5C3NGB8_9AGAM|nr:hypothetical protein OE88DRAFT_1649661 [Heliocybe sulcata]
MTVVMIVAASTLFESAMNCPVSAGSYIPYKQILKHLSVKQSIQQEQHPRQAPPTGPEVLNLARTYTISSPLWATDLQNAPPGRAIGPTYALRGIGKRLGGYRRSKALCPDGHQVIDLKAGFVI